MKALLFLSSILLILLLAGLWIGNGSYPDRWRMKEEINTQVKANKEQKNKNRKIKAELDDVASGNDAIEERARSELGMTKKGETFYEVVLQPEVTKEPELNKLELNKIKKPKPLSAPIGNVENQQDLTKPADESTNE